MKAGATVVRGSFLLNTLCLQLALMLAQSAHEIQKKSPGRFLVKQLLKLQATKPSSVQVMQNVVCHVGESFEQNLVEIMVTPTHKHDGSLDSLMSAFGLIVDVGWLSCAIPRLLHISFASICSVTVAGNIHKVFPSTRLFCAVLQFLLCLS